MSACVRETKTEKERYSEIKTRARLCETNLETNRKKHQGRTRKRASVRHAQGGRDTEKRGKEF